MPKREKSLTALTTLALVASAGSAVAQPAALQQQPLAQPASAKERTLSARLSRTLSVTDMDKLARTGSCGTWDWAWHMCDDIV